MHTNIEPSILYFGTPVILLSTLNEDGSTNIAPISSVWWLGWSCMIGLDATSKSTENLKRTGECILNLASGDLAAKVNKLALLTGSEAIPLHKKMLGYKHSKNKFIHSGFTPQENGTGKLSAITECPIHLHARVNTISEFGQADERMAVPAYSIELNIKTVSAVPSVLMEGSNNKIDPNKWNPLIMNFREFFSLSAQLNESRLARKPEALYAPWKQKGIKRLLGKWLLTRSNKKYGH